MTNDKLQPHRSINYIGDHNFQPFSDRSYVSSFALIFFLKLDYTVKRNFQNTKRPS